MFMSIAGGFMIRSIFRSWSLPQCWCCGGSKVRPSRSNGFTDTAASLLLLRPFRC